MSIQTNELNLPVKLVFRMGLTGTYDLLKDEEGPWVMDKAISVIVVDELWEGGYLWTVDGRGTTSWATVPKPQPISVVLVLYLVGMSSLCKAIASSTLTQREQLQPLAYFSVVS